MQETQKRSIVIASVLKPVDDTRMLDKMGQSLLKAKGWEVHIVGYGMMAPRVAGIVFHPLGSFARLSLSRMFTPWRVLRVMMSIKPAMVIVNTHELLWVATIVKVLLQSKIYYDVRENYKLNILNTKAFPSILRWPVALYVRLKENILSPFIDHFLLAEKTYANELNFIRTRFTIVENKSIGSVVANRKPITSTIHFVFTGTLDSSTGVFEAIALMKKIHAQHIDVRLKIMGYAALPEVRDRIQLEVEGHDCIEVIGLTELVPHQTIMQAIAQADAGIIYYRSAPHTKNCIPTKLYEYLANCLPIVYDSPATWSALVRDCAGGVAIDFANPDIKPLIQTLKTTSFYPVPPQDVTWESEEAKFIQVFN